MYRSVSYKELAEKENDFSLVPSRYIKFVVGIIAAQSIGEPGTQLTMRTFHTGGVAGGDITQGLPRVEELFEARKPKKMATLSEIAGKVRFEDATKGSLLNIIVTADDGDTRTYSMPHTGLQVRDGEVIEKGRQLQDGALNPHDVLRIRGASAVHNYLIQEVLKVYRQQGVDINDKHIEVIVRQMMRKVRVEDANDATGLLSGAMADVLEVEDENAKVRARIAAGEVNAETGEPLQEATYTQLLMGITKASLATDSFLSAASFQETTKVPVSYTHLDVYKRQGQGLGALCPRPAVAGGILRDGGQVHGSGHRRRLLSQDLHRQHG